MGCYTNSTLTEQGEKISIDYSKYEYSNYNDFYGDDRKDQNFSFIHMPEI